MTRTQVEDRGIVVRFPESTGVICRWGQTGSGAHQASYSVGERGSFLRPGREIDRSPLTTAKVRNAWSHTTCLTRLRGVHKDNCVLTFTLIIILARNTTYSELLTVSFNRPLKKWFVTHSLHSNTFKTQVSFPPDIYALCDAPIMCTGSIRGSTGIGSFFLNLGTRQMSVVSFTSRSLYHGGRKPVPLEGRQGIPQNKSVPWSK